MLNRITIGGRLVRDPELRQTGSGIRVCSFCVAVERDSAESDGNKETDFFDCIAWRKDAEFVARSFQKNQSIIVSGRIQFRKREKDGVSFRQTELVADSIYFGDSRSSHEIPNEHKQ